MKNLLALTDIRYQINHATLLDGISLTISEGEICAVIGANGAGKTSLLKCLLGEMKATAGIMHFNDKPLPSIAINVRAKHIGVLPQNSGLTFPYTVEDVVLLGRYPHSSGQKIDSMVVSEVLKEMDISHLRKQPYTQLSGGEKQRAQLARVFAQIWRSEDAQPRLLILDEPSAALDVGHKQLLLASVEKLASDGVGVLWVEHDLNLVTRFAHTVCALHQGRMVARGDVTTELSASLVKQLYNADVTFIEDLASGKRVMAV